MLHWFLFPRVLKKSFPCPIDIELVFLLPQVVLGIDLFLFLPSLSLSLSFSPVFHDGGDGGGRADQILAIRTEQLPPLPHRQGKSQIDVEDRHNRSFFM